MTYFIFHFPWYRREQTSFRTIQTLSPEKLLDFGKMQVSTDAPAPFLGQRVASEASALSNELCHRVLKKVYGAWGRQRAWALCACRRLPIPYWAFESYVFSSQLRNPPHGGRCWIVFIFVGFRSPSSMKV